jgi:hypothetical protein
MKMLRMMAGEKSEERGSMDISGKPMLVITGVGLIGSPI